MKRPTIADLAKASGVSVSTVNRILSGAGGVRASTVQLVQDTAAEINFYGRGIIESRRKEFAPEYRMGFVLQQSTRELYRLFAAGIEAAARREQNATIKPVLEFVDDLAPENIAERMMSLGETCDAIAVIAGDHPLIGHAILDLRAKGIPVVTYITDLSAPKRAGFVGTDNWKLGRTAAWFIAETSRPTGKVALFIGNHRYQCQDISDASFRSYMREYAPDLVVMDSRPTHEEPGQAYDMVKQLLVKEPELEGIYVAGGGISGVLRALREVPKERQRRISVICRDIGPETRKGLTEHLITAALCHPLETTSSQLIETMISAVEAKGQGSILQSLVPFEVITPESM